jgi:hypothetical protein
MFQTKVVEEIKTVTSPPPENRAVYEVKCKNFVRPGKPQMTKWRMRNARWIPKATNTHSEYVTYWCSIVTMVVRTRLNVTLYAHCLSCFSKFSAVQKLLRSAGKYHSKPFKNKAGSRLPVPLACGYSGRLKSPSLWAVAALTHASSHLPSIMRGMTNSWALL